MRLATYAGPQPALAAWQSAPPAAKQVIVAQILHMRTPSVTATPTRAACHRMDIASMQAGAAVREKEREYIFQTAGIIIIQTLNTLKTL